MGRGGKGSRWTGGSGWGGEGKAVDRREWRKRRWTRDLESGQRGWRFTNDGHEVPQ